MSYNLHNLNIVVPATQAHYDATPPDGYRIAIIRWRETAEVKKSGKKVPAPRAVLVASIPLELTRPVQLQIKLREAIDKMQDDRIRDIMQKHLDNESNLMNVQIEPSDIDESGIAAWMKEESTGGRISGDSIQAWFNATMAAHIEAKALAKGMEPTKIVQTVNGYRATFMKLASPVTPITAPVLEKLTEVLAEATADNASVMDEKIANAIIRRMPKSEDDMLADL
jgi:hypothetical protein